MDSKFNLSQYYCDIDVDLQTEQKSAGMLERDSVVNWH